MKRNLIALGFASFVCLLSGEAGAKRRKAKAPNRPNLPPGWVWPPSKAMREEGKVCLDRLSAEGVAWERGQTTRKVATPVVVPAMELGGVKLTSVWRKPPFVMDCHLALAFARYGGPALRELGVSEVRFSSIHDYRNVAGTRHLSRHALGMAMDIFSFVTEDGAEHVIKADYESQPILRLIEDTLQGSGAYRTVLSPGNDPRRHDDHFHIEARAPNDRPWTPRRPRLRQTAQANVNTGGVLSN